MRFSWRARMRTKDKRKGHSKGIREIVTRSHTHVAWKVAKGLRHGAAK